MKNQKLEKLVRVLRIFVIAVLVCNYVALFFVPTLVVSSPKEMLGMVWQDVQVIAGVDVGPEWEALGFLSTTVICWFFVWFSQYHAVLTVFLLVCGICTAVILWQAIRVMDIMLHGSPFVTENALHLKKASLCCFVISFAAACRTVWGFFYYKSLSPLLTYNFLFCPLFLMGGLLFLVMSALFRQAAEMKAENDLTI